MKSLPQWKQRIANMHNSQTQEGDHSSNWAISYGDMVTLLLAFFVLFFNVDKSSSDIKLLDQMVKQEFDVPERKPDQVWGAEEKKKLAKSSQQVMDNIESIKTKIQGDKLMVQFPGTSFFGSAEFELTRQGANSLERFARVFEKFTGKMRIVVRGYTDNRPVKIKRGQRFKDNLELSALRAISALRALNSQGIPFYLMRIGGYGETDKAQRISPKDIRKFDRKIVLVIEPLDESERGFEALDWSRKPSSVNEVKGKKKETGK